MPGEEKEGKNQKERRPHLPVNGRHCHLGLKLAIFFGTKSILFVWKLSRKNHRNNTDRGSNSKEKRR